MISEINTIMLPMMSVFVKVSAKKMLPERAISGTNRRSKLLATVAVVCLKPMVMIRFPRNPKRPINMSSQA